MLKGLGVLFFVGLLITASIGLAGGGPHWLRYVGSGTLFFLLMLILTQVSNLPDRNEVKKIISGGDEGEELFSAEGADGQIDQGIPHDRDLMGKN